MKSKEEILKEHIALFRPKTMFGFPEVYKDSVLDAMDDYTSELRAELDEVKESRNLERILVEVQSQQIQDLIIELEAVKKERDEALNKINEMANWSGMENII